MRHFLILASLLFLVSCASAGQNPNDKLVSDPLEGLNRATFEFNYFLDGLLLKPLAALYRDLPPPAVREGFDNFLGNLDSPVTFANQVLQGSVDEASNTLLRFVINSTVGIAGLVDVAGQWGIHSHREDFGQTLASWGAEEGPYIVWPVFGPSNVRDTAGTVADFFMDPLRYILLVKNDEPEWYFARGAAKAVSARARTIAPLDDIEENSVDFYASIRSLYKQRRDFLIENRGTTAPGEEPVNATQQKKADAAKPNGKNNAQLNLQMLPEDRMVLSQKDLPYTPKFAPAP